MTKQLHSANEVRLASHLIPLLAVSLSFPATLPRATSVHLAPITHSLTIHHHSSSTSSSSSSPAPTPLGAAQEEVAPAQEGGAKAPEEGWATSSSLPCLLTSPPLASAHRRFQLATPSSLATRYFCTHLVFVTLPLPP